MTHLITQPGEARLYPPIPGPLFAVLAEQFEADQRTFDLFSEFLHHESYSRAVTAKLLAIAKGKDEDLWDIRTLATLMLHHQVLLLPPGAIEEFDFLLAELGLKASNAPLSNLKKTVFEEGFSTTAFRPFIQELRRKLDRHREVHQQINGAQTSERGLMDFIALSRQVCKLSLARYLFTPEEVVEEILKHVKVSKGERDMSGTRYPFIQEEAEATISYLPAYEAAILKKLCDADVNYWVSDSTPSTLNALVEYPLTTVALVVKPPGSDIEIEIKRTGRRGAQPLNAVYAREGYTVPFCHRFDGGCSRSTLAYEAGASALLAKIFRCIHGREAPIAKAVSIRWIRTVPSAAGEVSIEDYFTHRKFFGDGFRSMRDAMKEVVREYRERNKYEPLENPDGLFLTQHFNFWSKPAQATLVGTTSFRVPTVAGYLSPRGARRYFEEGIGAASTNENARRLVDEILQEILGVYQPPEAPYQSHEQYVAAAYAVPENRARATRLYLSHMREIGTFWGTFLAIRGYTAGESFVGRNVGVRSVWNEGQWEVELIFMDHDKVALRLKDEPDFRADESFWGACADERFIFGRRNIHGGLSTHQGSYFDDSAPHKEDTGSVEFLKEMYQINREEEKQGRAALFEGMEHAYRKTQDKLASDPELQAFFHPTFVERHRDWDTIVRTYLDAADNPKAIDSWKKKTRSFLRRKDYKKDLIDEHIQAVEHYADFLKQYAFLY